MCVVGVNTHMKKNFAILLLGASLLGGAANLNAQIKTDYDHSANFASYKTYSWIKVQAGNSLWDDRIKQDVDAQLAAKGWVKVDSNGDAAISAFRSTQDQQTLETFYNDFGGGWRWPVSEETALPRRPPKLQKWAMSSLMSSMVAPRSYFGVLPTAAIYPQTQEKISKSCKRTSTKRSSNSRRSSSRPSLFL